MSLSADNVQCIRMIEEMLDRARRGEVVGLEAMLIGPDTTVSYRWWNSRAIDDVTALMAQQPYGGVQ